MTIPAVFILLAGLLTTQADCANGPGRLAPVVPEAGFDPSAENALANPGRGRGPPGRPDLVPGFNPWGRHRAAPYDEGRYYDPYNDYPPRPYEFNYVAPAEGGYSSRQESSDELGRVVGSYTLQDEDGRFRVVDYVADIDGFRATVRTNEPGTESKNPADVIFESTAVAYPDYPEFGGYPGGPVIPRPAAGPLGSPLPVGSTAVAYPEFGGYPGGPVIPRPAAGPLGSPLPAGSTSVSSKKVATSSTATARYPWQRQRGLPTDPRYVSSPYYGAAEDWY